MPYIPVSLVEKILLQAPEVAILPFVAFRLDSRMAACFEAMHTAMDRLLEAVIGHEDTNT